MPIAVESLAFEGIVYDVEDELHHAGFENLWIWFLLKSGDGEEMILEEFMGQYTLLVEDDSVEAFEPVHQYTVTFNSVTDTPSWLHATILCSHGPSGDPTMVADRVYRPIPVDVGPDAMLYPNGNAVERPVVSDANALARVFVVGPPVAGTVFVLEQAPARVVAEPAGPAEAVLPGEAPNEIQVEDVREVNGRPELRVRLGSGALVWLDGYTAAREIVNGQSRYFLIDSSGARQTFHIGINRDGSWGLESYDDAEVDPDVVVVFET